MNRLERHCAENGETFPGIRAHVQNGIQMQKEGFKFAESIRAEIESNPSEEGKRLALLARLETGSAYFETAFKMSSRGAIVRTQDGLPVYSVSQGERE